MKKTLIFISFFIVVFASAYYITLISRSNDIIQGKKYTLQIIDSIQTTDDIVPFNYYAQNGYWIKIRPGKANFYEMNAQHPLKASIRGATSLCPDPNKRTSRKNLERARMFSVGKNSIITYDDLNQIDRQGKLIRKQKTDLANKVQVMGCNYSQTNDTLVILSGTDLKRHSDSLRFAENEPLLYIVNLKTGKTMYKVGSFPEIYQTKKYLGYLPHYNFATDFENKRIFYQCEGSPLIRVAYWETGKTETFGMPCNGYLPPECELRKPSTKTGEYFSNEYYSQMNECRSKSFMLGNIYYESQNDYIFRQFILPKKE